MENNTSTTINGKDDYTAVISITNNSKTRLAAGKLEIRTNPRFTFDSSLLMQEWANDSDDVSPELHWLHDTLGSTSVNALEPGARQTVIVHASASSDVMQLFRTWGPKPLSIRYLVGDVEKACIHSFVTRTQDGLNLEQTPQLNVVVALPLTTSQWKATNANVKKLLTQSGDTDDAVTSLGSTERSEQEALTGVLARHKSIQVVGDPSYAQTFETKPNMAAIMQPDGFDIAYQAQTADQHDWQSTGLKASMWNAASGGTLYRDAVGDEKASVPTAVAWQSTAQWTTKSLAAAKSQGYSIVVAESGYDPSTPSAVHTSKMVVPTSAGNVTVLNTQRDLSTLAQGKATSDDALAETTESGRLARIVAQTALYQQEGPYESRTLLVSLGQDVDSTDTANMEELVSKLESCSWLKLDSLASLIKAQPYVSSEEAAERASAVKSLGGQEAITLGRQVRDLGRARSNITRFVNQVLVKDSKTASSSASPSASADTRTSGNDRPTATQWARSLNSAYLDLARKSFSSFPTENTTMIRAARQLGNGLLSGISVAQPDSINIVSQSAKMPITIANDHPYPVHIHITAATDSELFTASVDDDLVIPAHAEVQSTVNIHVLNSGSTNVTVQLQDRSGVTFGSSASARVTSVFQINDWSGYAILALAVLLGVFGLWRQFHRVKDPDE
ncbi:hypothetical protein CS006_03540 [Bifidobacterium primatium]|uniref:Uncharacterized protein n=1 Tax=Bifidobacterium primatium TaxID=2045438 RepID=A0A2M9HBM5_9BIFI|nr:hypothetical protein CS006_03540 [Bifidobacterium primatium]